LLRERSTDPKLARGLNVIDRQVEQLVRLVDDLLDVSRITHGRFALRAEPMLLRNAIDRAVEASAPLLHSHRQHLSVVVPPRPFHVAGDMVRLTQVFTNLLANASKFTPDGGAIEVSLDIEDAHAVAKVADSGTGIESGLLPHVFDPFVQQEPALGRAPSGIGIGLTLARRIVELHGGTIEAHSAGRGQGSEFTLRLPIVDNVDAAALVPGAPEAPPRGASRRVLVIDDNVDAADSMRELLELEGYEARCDYNGAAGLQTAMEFKPELVLLDLGLPGMDGYEVLRRLRALPGTQPVVAAVTGYGHTAERERMREAGFDHELTKPADPKLLYALLDSLNKRNGE
jgi:CheY-like chemotaxis protein